MKDQVANLQKRNIKAIALTGGIKSDEMIDLLDNCQFGNYKFLYLSPERLQSDWIMERIKNLPISLITIDEAHCVSQWGHMIRPAYLKISNFKTHFPKVPSCFNRNRNAKSKEDIIKELGLKEPQLLRNRLQEKYCLHVLKWKINSFESNKFLEKTQSSIIYVRNRKSCIEIFPVALF
jgi:ATP-dependent DNA helicase RecQ